MLVTDIAWIDDFAMDYVCVLIISWYPSSH